MKKPLLWTAVLALATAWALAQGAASQKPDQSQQPDQSPAKTGHSVEGCLSGAADEFVLTDATGKTYLLTGDTSGLKDNVGHKVRLQGNVGSTGGGDRISASGTQATFGVEKVKSLSDTCK